MKIELGERGVGDSVQSLEPDARVALRGEEPRVLDAHSGAVTGQLKERDIIRPEHARRERADMEHTDQIPADGERHAHHRLDPFVVKDRVEHIGMVDVVEHDRPPLRSDAPREPPPDRDPYTALHLFLDPDGGARDELTCRLLEEQDSGSVGVEHLLRSLEQRAEKLLEPQVRERGVCELLQTSKPLGVIASEARCHAGIVAETAAGRGYS